MTTKNPAPARLFVLFARSAPMGLILRRGPSNWVQLIRWNTKTDVFRQGHWFHGRILERRCDLSPDGKYFAYAAFKPGNKLRSPDIGDRWTAVSKPPFLTAVALWGHRDSYSGGGYFFKDGTMLLNQMDGNHTVHPAFRVPEDLEVKTMETYQDESYYMGDHIHLSVMYRDGWTRARTSPRFHLWSLRDNESQFGDSAPLILERSRSNFTLTCAIYRHYPYTWHVREEHVPAEARRALRPYRVKSYRRYEYSYQYRYAITIDGIEHNLDGVTWADLDQRKRLVLAKEGKLFSASTDAGELVLTELGDFNYSRQG